MKTLLLGSNMWQKSVYVRATGFIVVTQEELDFLATLGTYTFKKA